MEAQDGDHSWIADYNWLTIHLGIKPQQELWRAKQQLESAHEELKELGYISEYCWDGWRIIYCPGPIWKGEQLRRKSGKVRRRTIKPIESVKRDGIAIHQSEPCDPLIPALAAFASGLPVGEKRIKALGLTIEQATALCQEKQLPICNR